VRVCAFMWVCSCTGGIYRPAYIAFVLAQTRKAVSGVNMRVLVSFRPLSSLVLYNCMFFLHIIA